jgi:NADH:ubiquinone oxidoreductase subunit 6 (subunit J)
MEHPMFSDSSTQVPPTTVDFAVSILNDWAIITIVLGLLLAMAMIGASYLVRDERLVNLLYDMGGEER